MKYSQTWGAALLALGMASHAATSPAPAPAPAAKPEDGCRSEVSKFEQAIGFVRQNQGNQAAQDLKERLLPAKLENEILMKDGYCGLAKYIRDKKLNR